MTKIAAIVLSSLSIFLGMFFFFIGYIKLSPSLNRDIHREIRRSFVRYAKVVPLFKQMGWKVSPGIYRKVIGFTEIIAGLLLAFMPDVYKFYVSLFLMCITLGAVYTHIMVDDDIGKMYPAIAFTIMLICRLILYCLLRRHQRQQLKLRAKQAELAELKEKVGKTQHAIDESEKESEAKTDNIEFNTSSSKSNKKTRKRSKKQPKEN